MNDTLKQMEDHGDKVIHHINMLDTLAQTVDDEMVRVAIEETVRNLRSELTQFTSAIADIMFENA